MSKLHCPLPEELAISSVSNEEVEVALYISAEVDYFKGHFPQAPILAGVVQLDWAIYFGRKFLDVSSNAVKNLEVLKFQVVIQPAQKIKLMLVKKSDYKFTFKYVSDKGVHASGRIVLEEL